MNARRSLYAVVSSVSRASILLASPIGRRSFAFTLSSATFFALSIGFIVLSVGSEAVGIFQQTSPPAINTLATYFNASRNSTGFECSCRLSLSAGFWRYSVGRKQIAIWDCQLEACAASARRYFIDDTDGRQQILSEPFSRGFSSITHRALVSPSSFPSTVTFHRRKYRHRLGAQGHWNSTFHIAICSIIRMQRFLSALFSYHHYWLLLEFLHRVILLLSQEVGGVLFLHYSAFHRLLPSLRSRFKIYHVNNASQQLDLPRRWSRLLYQCYFDAKMIIFLSCQ